MVANLYMHPDTFRYNNRDSQQQVACKLKALVEDMVCVVNGNGDENKFKVPTSIFSVPVFKQMQIVEMAEMCLDNDEKGVFYTMLSDTSETYDNLTMKELREMGKYSKDEKEIHSLLVLNVPEEDLTAEEKALDEKEAKMAHKSVERDYITFDTYQVVYSRHTWMHLRRQILGNHPVSRQVFVAECRKYFPNLCFHKNCTASLDDGEYNYVDIIPRTLVYYLSCLNDQFCRVYQECRSKGTVDANSILKHFSGQYSLDEPGSLQQNPEKKEMLTFQFKNKHNQACRVLCEPHLKISQTDKNYNGKAVNYDTFHPRIYFAFPNSDVEDGRLPIGSMGKHI